MTSLNKSVPLIQKPRLRLGSTDRVFVSFLRAVAVVAAMILFMIGYYLVVEVVPLLRGPGFSSLLQGREWNPTSGFFSMVPMLVGSIAVTLGAMILAFPLAMGCAVSLHLYFPPMIQPYCRRLLEILGGVPSVVFGFWGLVVLVPFINRIHPPGASLLAAIIVLALMILPIAALMIDAALGTVPRESLQAVRALGLGSYEILTLAMIPHARSGIWTAMLLSAGRAIGETMAVLMVCGNIVQLPKGLFDPIRTLTSNIALELGYAQGLHRSALFASGLFLVLIVLTLILLSKLVSQRRFGEDSK